MTEQALDILKLGLLGLLYLFFARVLWAVWSEVKAPAGAARAPHGGQPIPQAPATSPARKPRRGTRGVPARLTVIEPKQRKGVSYPIGVTGGISFGRDSTNAVVLDDDSYASGHHAKVAVIGGRVVLDDLNSRNGTFLNGNRVTTQRELHIGDRIQIGYTVLEAQ